MKIKNKEKLPHICLLVCIENTCIEGECKAPSLIILYVNT